MVKSYVGCGYPGLWLHEVMRQVQELASSKDVGRSHTDKEEESQQAIFPAESIRSLGSMRFSLSTRTSRASGVLWVSAQSAQESDQ
jgi:hypothetical protein